MNTNYINRHLIIWAELMYGKDAKCYSKQISKKGTEYYIFGSEKLNIENRVSKEFALYLSASSLPGGVAKTRFQIQYLDLEVGVVRVHSHGAVYDKVQVEKEIAILKKEQKQLKKLKLPKTKTNFEKVKVTII